MIIGLRETRKGNVVDTSETVHEWIELSGGVMMIDWRVPMLIL